MGEHRTPSSHRGSKLVGASLVAGGLLLAAPASMASAAPAAGSAVGNNLQNFLGGVGKNLQGIAGGTGKNLQSFSGGLGNNLEGHRWGHRQQRPGHSGWPRRQPAEDLRRRKEAGRRDRGAEQERRRLNHSAVRESASAFVMALSTRNESGPGAPASHYGELRCPRTNRSCGY